MSKKRIIELTAEYRQDGGLKFRVEDMPLVLQEHLKKGQGDQPILQVVRHLTDGRIDIATGDFILRVTARVDIAYEDVGAILNEVLDKTDRDWKRATVMLTLALAEASYHSKMHDAEVSRLLKRAREECPIGAIHDDPPDDQPPDKPTLQLVS
jgi:hypothetical protein